MAKVAPRTWLALWDSVPALRRGALAVALGIYAFASLEPFDWQLPRQVANRAEQTPDGWRFAAPGIALAPPPHDWLEAARAAETLELSLTVRPHSATQAGPARILTISRDTHMRNLTLGQEDDDLVLRLRTEDTDLNGLIAGEPFARVEDVFRSGRWLTIDLRIEPGRLSIAVDGRPAPALALPPRVLATWEPAFALALGNETTCDRSWLGEIRAAVVRVPGGHRDYARAGIVRSPASCWVIGYPPALVPFRPFLPEDALWNVLMYVPLGLLFGLIMRHRGRFALVRGVPLIAGISVSFETAQLLVESRFTSIDDVLCNTLGGGLGIALALALTKSWSARA